MDTDGTISARGRSSFTTTSDRLAQDVYELVVGLGIKASRRERPAKLYGKTCGTSYDIGFTAYDDQPVFRLLRKRDRLRTRGAGRPGDSGGRRIVSVEPVPTRPVRCIQVDSPSHLYLAGESMIPTHNTEVVMNYLGSRIHKDPGPTMVVQPTLGKARSWSKIRLAPMIRDSKALRGKVADARTRDSGNTTLQKTYAGGHLTIVGANSAADLSSDPIRDFLGDEIDRYPASAGTEGDPLSLGIQRTRNFWNRKVLLVSSPGDLETSRIWPEWLASDMRRYFVPCPHCDHSQVLVWKNVKWESEEVDGETVYRPETAVYVCGESAALRSREG